MADPVTVSSRVVVPAAPDQVWQAVIDWSGHHRWIVQDCLTRSIQLRLLSTTPRERRLSASLTRLSSRWLHARDEGTLGVPITPIWAPPTDCTEGTVPVQNGGYTRVSQEQG
jgi:hypothetical protein